MIQQDEWPLTGLESIPGWSGLSICGMLYESARDAQGEGMNVEIGCYFGRTSVAICRALMDRGKGERLLSIDPFEVPDGEEDLRSHMSLFPKPWEETMRKHVLGAGVTNHDLVKARSSSPEARAAVTGPVRFAFIDGDHRPKQVWEDTAWLLPLMTDGGIMVFDDYGCNVSRWGVTDAVEKLVRPRVRNELYIGRGGGSSCRFLEIAA